MSNIAENVYKPFAAPPIVVPPDLVLDESDGEPLESEWHVLQIPMLLDVVRAIKGDRRDYFAGGNMFIYYSVEQARNKDYRGPDFFFVEGVQREPLRPYWAIWKENYRFPDVIVELTSPTTAAEDRTKKKDIYEKIFRTPEYYIFDAIDQDDVSSRGWRLNSAGKYEEIAPNEKGWLWCERLGCWFGIWCGEYLGAEGVWFRAYDRDGKVILLSNEAALALAEEEKKRAAEAKKQTAEAKKQTAEALKQADEADKRTIAEKARADSVEAELARLKESIRQSQTKGSDNASS